MNLKLFIAIGLLCQLSNAFRLPTKLSSSASSSSNFNKQSLSLIHTTHTEYNVDQNSKALSFCNVCINFADQALNQLLNLILQVGVVGTCGEVCSLLAQKTGSQLIGTACNLLCDFAGIEEFIKIVDNADLDPIYYCELLKACEINDNGDAKITRLAVSPTQGAQGTQFVVDLRYTSLNGTGTGEIAFELDTVDDVPLGDTYLNLPQKPGNYEFQIKFQAKPDPDCDPTQGPCEQWLPGKYNVKMYICNGECGSKHPHSKIYDQGQTSFTITN